MRKDRISGIVERLFYTQNTQFGGNEMVAIDQAHDSYKCHSATVVAPGASTGVREYVSGLRS